MIDTLDITGLVLVCGRGSRMGRVDKGCKPFAACRWRCTRLMRLQMQVGVSLINANRNLAAYESFGAPVWPDANNDYAGPWRFSDRAGTLRNALAAHRAVRHPRFFRWTWPAAWPRQPMSNRPTLPWPQPLKMTATAITVRPQPVFCLLRVDLLESLVRFTQAGGRKIDAWTAQHRCVTVPFDTGR